MFRQVIVDTGILVALIDLRDYHHAWVAQQFTDITPPEAVLSETWFLLQRVKNGRETLLQLLSNGQIEVQFDLQAELSAILTLISQYRLPSLM